MLLPIKLEHLGAPWLSRAAVIIQGGGIEWFATRSNNRLARTHSVAPAQSRRRQRERVSKRDLRFAPLSFLIKHEDVYL